MTSRVRAVCGWAEPAKTGGSRLTSANVLAVACGLAFLGQLGLPAPAYAQWGKLEKLSGPGTFSGWAFEFRAACFGDPVDESLLDGLAARAASATETARKSTERDSQQWRAAADAWEAAARAWAFELGHKYEAPPPHEIEKGRVDYQRLAEDLRAAVNRAPATMMATSSAGVAWSLCNPNKKRRLALDIGWITWESDPDPNYAGGAAINLDTLMASISWRALQGTDFDFVEVSAGGGMYWFTSTGFESLKGVVLQPARLIASGPLVLEREVAEGHPPLCGDPGVRRRHHHVPRRLRAQRLRGRGRQGRPHPQRTAVHALLVLQSRAVPAARPEVTRADDYGW